SPCARLVALSPTPVAEIDYGIILPGDSHSSDRRLTELLPATHRAPTGDCFCSDRRMLLLRPFPTSGINISGNASPPIVAPIWFSCPPSPLIVAPIWFFSPPSPPMVAPALAVDATAQTGLRRPASRPEAPSSPPSLTPPTPARDLLPYLQPIPRSRERIFEAQSAAREALPHRSRRHIGKCPVCVIDNVANRSYYLTTEDLINVVGFDWDENSKKTHASELAWQQYMQFNPLAAWFKGRRLSIRNDLLNLFKDWGSA
ncbi:hypothetical protein Taro_015529, partial [Colocasia esculenta]|nr:hypothetical protein [Colocasia esculenta]